MGRRRYIPELKSSKAPLRAFGKRVAMNAPIQGSAADIMKIAMLNADRALKESGLDARIVMQVHDELLVEVKDSEKEACREVLRQAMESAVKLSIPLTVDVSSGKSWLEQE
jgi:DNA polymerase-1